jgi:hypothetical protein
MSPAEPPVPARPIINVNKAVRGPRISIEMARVAAQDINDTNYFEQANAEELRDGDILPGHAFVLGRPETYGRELLGINLGRTSAIHEVMRKAREIAAVHSGDQKGLAIKIAEMVDANYSDLQGHGKKGMLLTLGFFQEEGGCCRHRAAELHLALKEAGIHNRYIRSMVFGGWHAWVEIDVDGSGLYSYVIDPNKKIRGKKEKLNPSEDKFTREKMAAMGVPPEKLDLYKIIDERNNKREWYIVDPERFNVVWRRREAPNPVHIE